MTARDIFGLIIRVAGVGFVIMSIFDAIHAIGEVVGLPIESRYPLGVAVTAGIFYLVIGLILITAAETITRLVYGRGDH